MLWGLPYALLAILGAVPLILYLNSLRSGGPKHRTTALFIWERVLAEHSLVTRLGWFVRKNLLLVLQIVAAALLIAALAEPTLTHFGRPGGDMIVVVDLSASMKARGPAGSRFEAARRELFALLDALPADRRMMLIGAAVEPKLIVPYTTDRERLRQAAREVRATDTPGNVRDAVVLAHSFLRKGSRDRIVIVTDGAFAGAEEFARNSRHVQVVEVAGGSENVAIVGFGLRQRPDNSAQYEIMAKVRNYGTQSVNVPLTLTLNDQRIAYEELAIRPGGQRVVVHPWNGDPAGVLIAQLDDKDDFATDNRAVLTTSVEAPLRVLYVGPGNPALHRLLRVFPWVRLTAVATWNPETPRQDAGSPDTYDVVIFDRVTAPELPAGNMILINTLAPGLSLNLQGESKGPRIVSPLATHPVTKGLNLGDLRVSRALHVSVEGDGKVLARSTDGPLMVAWERPGLRAIFLGFDLAESDLPLRVAFPVLMHNAFEWFRPGRREFPPDAVRSGEPIALYVAPGDSGIEIVKPSGATAQLQVAGNPVRFADTSEAGIHTYRSANREGRFAVNLLDEAESDIRSRIVDAPATTRSTTDHDANTGLPLWPFLLAAVVLLLAAELWLARRTRPGAASMLLRASAVTVLVVAWVNPRNFQATEALDVIVSVDVSHSVGETGMHNAGRLLDAAASLHDARTRTGVLAFARAPEWEFPPRQDPPAADFATRPEGDASDVQAALQAALAQVGEGRQGRVLLISDGNANRGDTSRVVGLLRAQGIEVWTLPVGLAGGRNEIFVSGLNLPRQVDRAESFEISGRIESQRTAAVRVRLLRSGVLIGERELELKAGTNDVRFSDSLDAYGAHGYELLVEAKDDILAENNTLKGVVHVKGPPRVLVVTSQADDRRFLSRSLREQGFSVVDSSPDASMLTHSELAAYEMVVLENVPAFKLTQAKMENIATYVRDLGGGLLVVGGAQSYGAGGYFRTPLERVLPVDMRPPARLELPHVALLLLIDKSGSMGGGPEGDTKLDLAKAAAAAAADVMNPTDQIGILAFDAGWHWTLPFRTVGKGEWMSGVLSKLRADGGTKLYDALAEARRAMLEKEAAIRHVIVLSDGLSEKADFQSLSAELARSGVTLSTVSVGTDADVDLLAELARVGNGRGYLAVDPHLVPQIFTAETLLVSRDLLVERTFAPRIVRGTGPMRGFTQRALPPLRGYVLTYAKPRAELLMTTGEDPLLVSWRHGLGRVTAFTSDLGGRWGREWVAWQGLPQWTSQIARATMRRIAQTRTNVTFRAEGDTVRIVADLVSTDGQFRNQLDLQGKITGPSGKAATRALPQTAPGRYEGVFSPSERGIHYVTLFTGGGPGEESTPVITAPYVASYSGEYRELTPNLDILSQLAKDTGGEVLNPQNLPAGFKRLYAPMPGKAFRGDSGWWPLAALGLLLFLADLVLRSVRRRTRAAA